MVGPHRIPARGQSEPIELDDRMILAVRSCGLFTIIDAPVARPLDHDGDETGGSIDAFDQMSTDDLRELYEVVTGKAPYRQDGPRRAARNRARRWLIRPPQILRSVTRAAAIDDATIQMYLDDAAQDLGPEGCWGLGWKRAVMTLAAHMMTLAGLNPTQQGVTAAAVALRPLRAAQFAHRGRLGQHWRL